MRCNHCTTAASSRPASKHATPTMNSVSAAPRTCRKDRCASRRRPQLVSSMPGSVLTTSREYSGGALGRRRTRISDARVNTWNGPTRSRIWLPGAASRRMRRVAIAGGPPTLSLEPFFRCGIELRLVVLRAEIISLALVHRFGRGLRIDFHPADRAQGMLVGRDGCLEVGCVAGRVGPACALVLELVSRVFGNLAPEIPFH